jgi:hypothetical protein
MVGQCFHIAGINAAATLLRFCGEPPRRLKLLTRLRMMLARYALSRGDARFALVNFD